MWVSCERKRERAKAIYMFIIVGVYLQCGSACDVSYSESLNWNSYFNYYVIHDFMKFELVHFVYSSCLFSCLKAPAQAQPAPEHRESLPLFFPFFLSLSLSSFNFVLFSYLSFCFHFNTCIALITFHNQLSESVSAQSSLLTFVAADYDDDESNNNDDNIIIERKITWATNWDYILFLDLVLSFVPCLLIHTHAFDGVHIDFHWKKKYKRTEDGTNIEDETHRAAVKWSENDIQTHTHTQCHFALRQIILITTLRHVFRVQI